jgi:hypothetical protein
LRRGSTSVPDPGGFDFGQGDLPVTPSDDSAAAAGAEAIWLIKIPGSGFKGRCHRVLLDLHGWVQHAHRSGMGRFLWQFPGIEG